MTQIDADPALRIRNLLVDEWDAANTSGLDANAHTGWYDYGAGGPQVTVTNPDSFALGGGPTGHSATDGDGNPVQIRAGRVLVNGWAGTRTDLRGQGPGGDDINPKTMAFQLGSEIHRIVQTNATALPEFITVGADNIRGLVDTDGPDAVFRQEVTVRFVRRVAASP